MGMRTRLHGWTSAFVGALFLLYMLLPSLVVLQFHLDRARIEREICVMRDAEPGRNTCHGNCYLMKQLRKAEGQAEHPFEHMEWRSEPAVLLDQAAPELIPPVVPVLHRTDRMEALPSGWHRPIEPVPWG